MQVFCRRAKYLLVTGCDDMDIPSIYIFMKNRPLGFHQEYLKIHLILCIFSLQGFLHSREGILLHFYRLQFILGRHFMPCFYLFLIKIFFVRLQSGKMWVKMQSFRTLSFLIFFYACLLSLIIVMLCQVVENSVLWSPSHLPSSLW